MKSNEENAGYLTCIEFLKKTDENKKTDDKQFLKPKKIEKKFNSKSSKSVKFKLNQIV
jgi:hypothetical protein